MRSVRRVRCAPRAVAAALTAVLPLCGCTGNGVSASNTPDDSGSFEATPLPEKLGAGRTVVQSRTRIAPGQVGLEVLTWQISVDTEQFNQAIVTYGAPAVATADEMSLNSNGLILRAVNANALDSLRNALGGSALEMRCLEGVESSLRPYVERVRRGALAPQEGWLHLSSPRGRRSFRTQAPREARAGQSAWWHREHGLELRRLSLQIRWRRT